MTAAVAERRGYTAEDSWALVQQAQLGDRDAFGALYDRYHDTVYRFVYFRCGHRQLAEDITGDVFVRALRRIGAFTWQGRDLGAWLVTIARNLVADHFKSGRYRLEVTTGDVLDEDKADSDHGPEAQATDHLRNLELLAALWVLGEDQRRVVVMRFLNGMDYAEIAVAMGKTYPAVKELQYRAIRNLRRSLPEGFER